MSDDPKKKGRQDRSRINTSQDYEVEYWSKKFGISPDELKAAVNKVGNSVPAVQQELSRATAVQQELSQARRGAVEGYPLSHT